MVRKSDRLRVAVLMGGPSSEHEVSLQGGKSVVESLDRRRFAVRPVVITRQGRWRVAPRPFEGEEGGFDPHASDAWRETEDALRAVLRLRDLGTDVVLPVLHGRFGEDGTLQACLAAAGLSYVGSDSRASAVANDKVLTKEVLAFHGVRTPPFEVLSPEAWRRGRSATARALVERFGLPLVVKDPTGGSSLEVRIGDDEGQVSAALEELGRGASRLLVEAFVRGRELTGAVVEDPKEERPVALPLVEIRPRRSRTFDYFEKYDPDGAEELCPAPVPEDVEREGRALALRVHALLGLRGLSRTDLILDDHGVLQVLEVNTLPGMTARSLVPRAAAAQGISFSALLENLVRTARP
jgi:D-alanine-D-alanine ligase